MKKIVALLLAILTILSLCACGNEAAAPETTEPAAAGRDYSQFAGIVHDTKTWYDTLMALPIASPDMTEQELRTKTLGMNYALCVIQVQVKDASGNVVAEIHPQSSSTPLTFSIPASAVLPEEALTPYADGNHTVTVSVRMANGELKEALTTTLKN